MAKVFYLGGGTHALGMLRAVVTLEQLNSLVPLDTVTYLGTEFPGDDFGGHVTVVQVSLDETVEPWASGFSRIHAMPAEFDERLTFLPQSEVPIRKTPQAQRRNGSGLIHWLRDKRSCE